MSTVDTALHVLDRNAGPRAGTVGAFVLTFRRQAPLREAIVGLEAQHRRPDSITVLNCDQDLPLRAAFSRTDAGVEVIDLPENVGSGGGFKEALRLACQRGIDWAWLLDDDCVPDPQALSELLRAANAQPERARVGILASVQVASHAVYGVSRWRDGLIAVPEAERLGRDPFFIDVAYWAGLLVSRRVIETVGYPRTEFFRCFADYEYCLRARRAGFRALAVPTSHIQHDHGPPNVVVRLGRPSVRLRYPPSRYYYHVRNAAYTTRFVLHSPKAMLFHALLQVRQAAGDLIYSDRKARRVWLRALGLAHGFTGRLGRRADLE